MPVGDVVAFEHGGAGQVGKADRPLACRVAEAPVVRARAVHDRIAQGKIADILPEDTVIREIAGEAHIGERDVAGVQQVDAVALVGQRIATAFDAVDRAAGPRGGSRSGDCEGTADAGIGEEDAGIRVPGGHIHTFERHARRADGGAVDIDRAARLGRNRIATAGQRDGTAARRQEARAGSRGDIQAVARGIEIDRSGVVGQRYGCRCAAVDRNLPVEIDRACVFGGDDRSRDITVHIHGAARAILDVHEADRAADRDIRRSTRIGYGTTLIADCQPAATARYRNEAAARVGKNDIAGRVIDDDVQVATVYRDGLPRTEPASR